MITTGLIILIIIALCVWFWESSLRANELAVAASKKACQEHQLQLLDGTVHFQKICLKRNSEGRVRFLRCYAFDYYDGQTRLTTTITIFDNQVIDINLPPIESGTEFEKKRSTQDSDTESEKNRSTEDNVIQFPKERKK